MKRVYKQLNLLPCCVLLLLPFLAGCFAIRPMAGADVDLEQLAKAREAAVMAVRYEAAKELASRLADGHAIDAGDMSLSITEAALNKVAAQLDSTSGWLDTVTTYKILHTAIAVHNGSAIATITLTAHSIEHNVDVLMLMDCLVTLHIERAVLKAHLEPFNIAPEVTAYGLKKLVSGIIRDVISIRLSSLAATLPSIDIPIDIHNHLTLPGNDMRVRSGLNMDIHIGRRELSYDMTIRDVRFFEKNVFISFALTKIGVM
jgi:hypothetical protein